MTARGLNAHSGPEQPGLLTAVPESLTPKSVSSWFLGSNRPLTTTVTTSVGTGLHLKTCQRLAGIPSMEGKRRREE